MPRKPTDGPTDTELAILLVLWEIGPSPVGRVHNVLSQTRQTGYSTTLKMMQVMHAKKLLTRDESVRPHLYRPTKSREQTQAAAVHGLVRKLYDGSARRMLVHALERGELSTDDLGEIKETISKLETAQ